MPTINHAAKNCLSLRKIRNQAQGLGREMPFQKRLQQSQEAKANLLRYAEKPDEVHFSHRKTKIN